MSYQSITIREAVEGINEKYFLPDIQREYVWKPEQAILLMDSVLRGYPMNSFLFWNISKNNHSQWDIYEFIQNFDPRYPRNEERTNKFGIKDLVLVLDGQQRLTSLFIALTGTYTIKEKYARYDKEDSWSQKIMCIDLLKSPQDAENDKEVDNDLHFALRFLNEDEYNQAQEDAESYWFPIAEIMQPSFHQASGDFHEYVNSLVEDIPYGTTATFRHNIENLRKAIWDERYITFYEEEKQDSDRVLDIFARTNLGGTRLTKSDLLFSMVTSSWKKINARQEINRFVDKTNKGLDRDNDLDKDFILKTAMVITDQPVRYKMENFTNERLSKIEDEWDNIKRAIEDAVVLVNSFGIDESNLTSANALIPIIYYCYKNPNLDLVGSEKESSVRNRKKIQQWLIMTLVNNVFSRQTDNVLSSLRKVLQAERKGSDFPIEALNKELLSTERGDTVANTIEKILSTEYGESKDLLVLSLMYKNKFWGRTVKYEKDHVFPRSRFKGLSEELQELCNRLGNLQLLTENDNVTKSDEEFEVWLQHCDKDYRAKHLIPDDDTLFKLDTFKEFLAKREEVIRTRLDEIFIVKDEVTE